MLYLGGKARIAEVVAKAIRSRVPTGRGVRYLEPFIGGGSVFQYLAPHFEIVRAGDAHEDLVLMWQAAAAGWRPPREVSEDDYAAARIEPPSALRGFVGFGCSFGAKWWGGYARGHGGYAETAARSVADIGRIMAAVRADVRRCSYQAWEVASGDVIYCDPPYRGTTGYSVMFDSDDFWTTATAWSDAGARVFVSEYAAPPGWDVIWTREGHRKCVGTAGGGSGGAAVERLFARAGAYRAAPSQASLFDREARA